MFLPTLSQHFPFLPRPLELIFFYTQGHTEAHGHGVISPSTQTASCPATFPSSLSAQSLGCQRTRPSGPGLAILPVLGSPTPTWTSLESCTGESGPQSKSQGEAHGVGLKSEPWQKTDLDT